MSTLKTHNLQSPDAGSVNIVMAPNAGMVVAGLSTYSNQINVGSNIKLGNAGVVTATTFVGNLTGTASQVTIANGADNRVLTAASANTLNGESALTFDGTKILNISSSAGGFFQGTDTDGGIGLVEMGNGNVALQADTGNSISGSKIHFFVDNSEKMILDDSGRLLIGTTTEGHDDADELTLSGTRTGLTIRSANDNYGNIFFSDATSTASEYIGAVQYYHADNSMRFKTSSTDRVIIDSSGLMGLGTNNPQKNLHVYASSVATVRIETGDSRGQAWDLLSTNGAGTNTGTLSFRNEAGSSYLDLAANGGSPKTTFRNGGANDLLVVDNNGNVTKPRNAFAIIYTNSGDAGVSNNKIKDAYAVFTGVHLNQGSHYNTSTGKFTAPVDGVYGVAFSSNMNMSNFSVGQSFNIQTRKNGSIQIYNYNTVFTTVWQQMTFTNYVNCNANDYLQIYYGGSATIGADQGSGQWGELYFWLAQ